LSVAYLIFGGDMLVMAFMIAVVAWVSVRANDASITAAARIPLDDERPSLPVGAASAATRHDA
jgi:hypothetical protein